MENRNLLLAFVASFAIFYVFDMIFPSSKNTQTQNTTSSIVSNANVSVIEKDLSQTPNNSIDLRAKSIIPIEFDVKTEKYDGKLIIDGDKIYGMNLKSFKEDVNSEDPVVLLSKKNYVVSCGFKIGKNDIDLNWENCGSNTLSEKTPIKIRAKVAEGIFVERTISVDNKYVLNLSTNVINSSNLPISMCEKTVILKTLTDKDTGGSWTLNEGATGYLSGDLIEHNFDDIKKKHSFQYSGNADWAGLTDKYWLVALLNPSQKNNYNIEYSLFSADEKHPTYAANFSGSDVTIKSGESYKFKSLIFIGPKDIEFLDGYEKEFDIKHFDLAIDYGNLYFITKPILYLVNYINSILNSMGLTILFLTILIKLLLFPFANKSYKSMAKMRIIQPKIKSLQSVYGDDKQRLGQEMMALYKREKVNPLGGCLPSLMQFPILFALYKVLMICFGMRHSGFLWIKDLASPEPYSIFNLFGLLPFTLPDFLMVGTWALLMGGSMFLQQKMTPQMSADPQQQKMFMLMPVFLMFMMSSFPVGLLIYWTLSNVFAIVQQMYINKMAKV